MSNDDQEAICVREVVAPIQETFNQIMDKLPVGAVTLSESESKELAKAIADAKEQAIKIDACKDISVNGIHCDPDVANGQIGCWVGTQDKSKNKNFTPGQ